MAQPKQPTNAVNPEQPLDFDFRNVATVAPVIGFCRGVHFEQLLLGTGISQSDFDAVTGPTLWVPSQRDTARKVLDTICFGAVDAVGLPRPEIPSEYVAAVIALFVNPINAMSACSLYNSTSPASHLANRAQGAGTLDNVTNPTQLFALYWKQIEACNYDTIQAERVRIGKAFRRGTQTVGV